MVDDAEAMAGGAWAGLDLDEAPSTLAGCGSGLPRMSAFYRTEAPIASTYDDFFRTLLGGNLGMPPV